MTFFPLLVKTSPCPLWARIIVTLSKIRNDWKLKLFWHTCIHVYIYIIYIYIWVWLKKLVWIVPRVIRTYGTRSCQQAFWSGPCHKGLHGYEYKYIILSRYKYEHRKNTDIYKRNTYADIYMGAVLNLSSFLRYFTHLALALAPSCAPHVLPQNHIRILI